MVHGGDGHGDGAPLLCLQSGVDNGAVPAGIGDQEQHIALAQGGMGNHHIAQTFDALVGAGLAGAFMEHQIRFQNGIDAGQTAGPVEGLLANHVGMPRSEEVQQASVTDRFRAK